MIENHSRFRPYKFSKTNKMFKYQSAYKLVVSIDRITIGLLYIKFIFGTINKYFHERTLHSRS